MNDACIHLLFIELLVVCNYRALIYILEMSFETYNLPFQMVWKKEITTAKYS